MAPIRKRASIRSRAARSAKDPRGIYAPPSPSAFQDISVEDNAAADANSASVPENSLKRKGIFDDDFKVTKKDKRTIKHNQLLDKVQNSGIRKKPLKRRRPGKKLNTEMDGLADALPDVENEDEDDGWEGISDEEAGEGGMEVDGLRKAKKRKRSSAKAAGEKMEMKSLKHRPGAMKRKKIIEGKEMERFARNLAQMAAPAPQSTGEKKAEANTTTTSSSQADRWKALRSFLGQTMETNKAFGKA